jgi:hypothetical protein
LDVDRAADGLIAGLAENSVFIRDRLREPRVRRLLEAVLTGADGSMPGISVFDRRYALCLGLLGPGPKGGERGPEGCPGLGFANPIFRDVVVRLMTEGIGERIGRGASVYMEGFRGGREEPNLSSALRAFQKYWRNSYEALAGDFAAGSALAESIEGARIDLRLDADYSDVKVSRDLFEDLRESLLNIVSGGLTALSRDALSFLALLAFLGRALGPEEPESVGPVPDRSESGGLEPGQPKPGKPETVGPEPWKIELGDLAAGRKMMEASVFSGGRRYPLLVTTRASMESPARTREGLERLVGAMDSMDAKEGWLVAFDSGKVSWEEKIFWMTAEHKGLTTHLVGC